MSKNKQQFVKEITPRDEDFAQFLVFVEGSVNGFMRDAHPGVDGIIQPKPSRHLLGRIAAKDAVNDVLPQGKVWGCGLPHSRLFHEQVSPLFP